MRKNVAKKPGKLLEELLKSMRYIPIGCSLPDAEKILQKVFQESTGASAPVEWILQQAFHEQCLPYFETIPGENLTGAFKALSESLEAIRKQVKDFPLLIENILPPCASEEVFWVWTGYQDYVQQRQQFLRLLAWLAEFRCYDFDKEKIPYTSKSNVVAFTGIPDFNESGLITFQNDFLMKALEGADPKRLRQCEFCRSAFWAYRANAKFCQKNCTDAYFQQQRRNDPQKNNEINKKRKETYKSKKEQNQGKERAINRKRTGLR